MVRKIGIVQGGDSASDAARVRVVVAGAGDPFSVIVLDVDLTGDAVEPECEGGRDRIRVIHIDDVLHTCGKKGVHEVHEMFVTNP